MFEIPPDRQANEQGQCPQQQPPQPAYPRFYIFKKIHSVRLANALSFTKIDASQKHHNSQPTVIQTIKKAAMPPSGLEALLLWGRG